MWWIFTIVIAIVIFVFSKFLKDYLRQDKVLSAGGGIRKIYATVVDGLLKYSTARVIQEKNTYIAIAGVFNDPIMDRECGTWGFNLQITFAVLHVRYRAYIDLGDGERIDHQWDFPIKMDQNEIFRILKEYADKSNVYGILK